MRPLIFGAGVLGSFYAVKLLACGHEVTVLALGRRDAQLRADGLVVWWSNSTAEIACAPRSASSKRWSQMHPTTMWWCSSAVLL